METPVEGAREALMYFLAHLPEGAPESGMKAARAGAVQPAAISSKTSDSQLRELASQRFEKLM
jgi:hypothetical protein